MRAFGMFWVGLAVAASLLSMGCASNPTRPDTDDWPLVTGGKSTPRIIYQDDWPDFREDRDSSQVTQ